MSASSASAPEVIRRVVPELRDTSTPFKLCSDDVMLRLSLSKGWPRQGVGKFLTIYPPTEAAFTALIERCYEVTREMWGPYVLSDRPYKDSHVVFYRYGGHASRSIVHPSGEQVFVLTTPDGSLVPDERLAHYSPPTWVHDPFGEPIVARPTGAIRLKAQYEVSAALQFSARGGVYRATDTKTGEAVVIRESRPLVDPMNGSGDSARAALEKEQRITTRLGPRRCSPRFVDFFQEWEHWFLVEEFLDAETLWDYALGLSLLSDRAPDEAFGDLCTLVRGIGAVLKAAHEEGIVLRDLTKSNVMVLRQSAEVRLVDFELAYELDRDDPSIAGGTAGYMSPEQIANAVPTVAEDYYAFGGLILDALSFSAPGLELNRSGLMAALRIHLADHHWPTDLAAIVEGLTMREPARRWNIAEALDALDALENTRATGIRPVADPRETVGAVARAALRAEIRRTVDGIVTHILATADYSRDDRLCPASGHVFRTNPVSLQWGAAGLVHFLECATGAADERFVAWLRSRVDRRPCPPGLYVGYAGVALVLDGLGFHEEAVDLLARGAESPSLYDAPGFYYGAAGWGHANLLFHARHGGDLYIERARIVGAKLAASANHSTDGACWPSEGITQLGLGHGGSGVGVFLMHLFAATGERGYLDLAKSAVEFDFAARSEGAGRVDLRTHYDGEANLQGSWSPHMRHGSAGLGSALIRLWALTGETRYRLEAERIARTVRNRFSNKLWQDYGLAGYGEFLLDMRAYTGDDSYLDDTFSIAEVLVAHRNERLGGYAYAGTELVRLSCDYGMGSSGIGCFFLRLLDPSVGRFLFADELLATRVARASPKGHPSRGRLQPPPLVEATT